MDLPFVGVQGHQKALENTETLMKIDVFLCLVVQEPGVYRGGSARQDTPFLSRPVPSDPGISLLAYSRPALSCLLNKKPVFWRGGNPGTREEK